MKKRHLIERMLDMVDLHSEPIPGKPLIEIIGNYSLLIENHCGVVSYEKERIVVKTPKGCIQICGIGLVLTKMSKDILRVTGTIRTIELQGRG